MRTAIVDTPDDAAKRHRTGRVSTISRRFPRPRKSPHPWYTESGTPKLVHRGCHAAVGGWKTGQLQTKDRLPGTWLRIRYTNEVCP